LGRVAESLIRASGTSLGASGVGLIQPAGREAPRQDLQGVPHLRETGRFLIALDDRGGQLQTRFKPQLLQSMSGALRAPFPSAAAAPSKCATKTEKGVRKGMG
jgi:hypothetical protein